MTSSEIIRNCRGFLEERIDPDFGLLDNLLADQTIDWREKDEIRSKSSSCSRNSQLLDYILTKNKGDGLIAALRDADQMHIVNYLTANGDESDAFREDWPLTRKEMTILETNHRSLVDLLDLTDLLGRLYSSDVINRRQMDSISSKPTSHEKNEALLDILRRRSLRDYIQTIACLRLSQQRHIAETLDKGGVVLRVRSHLDGEDITEAENEIVRTIADILLNQPNRIRELVHQKVIAAKKGHSIDLYIYCETNEDLEELHESLASGRFKDSIELWFNTLLTRSQKIALTEVKIINEGIHKFFKEISRRDMKRGHAEDFGDIENILDRQLKVLVTDYEVNRWGLKRKPELTENWPKKPPKTEEDYQPSTTTLNELPLEMLDVVLVKSLLHWMLHSPTHQRDEDIIRTLTLVDFCWFQRITKRRFKKRFWKQLKDFYGETRKRSAIIRNNGNYLMENIQLYSTLVISLLSFDCITELQSRLIQRKRSNLNVNKTKEESHFIQGRHPDRYKNTELLCTMRSLDVTKFSNFLTCLRQANQKTVARIMENGGGVMKVDVQNNHGVNCTTSKETQLLIHQNIEDRRNRIKPCSLSSVKRISRLNDEGIEILNSQLERETVVVWIWCRSQTALHYIKRLYESNQLRKVLYGIANIPTSTHEIEHSNAIIIEENQFKKTVVVCPVSINFTQRIDLGKYDRVIGISKLRNEIYIMVCRSSSTGAISVFDDRIPFCLKKKIEINRFKYPDEMESCEKESCLYVHDQEEQCVWKIAIETEKQYETIKWLTFDYIPERMSVTSDGELLIINRSSSILMIYGSDATLLRSIQLPKHIKNLCYAVKTSIGNFVITNEEDEEEDEEEEEEKEEEKEEEEEKERETGSRQRKHKKQITYFLRELTSDGQTIIRPFIPSNETQQLKYPYYLSIDSDDQVFVADFGNHRVILLDSDLKWKCILCPTKDEEQTILSPWRLCYDEEKKQLIVGGVYEVNVYSLSRN